jgi:Zn-dependent protease with chaperone function
VAIGHDVTLSVEPDSVLIRSRDGVIAQDWPLPDLVAQAAPDGSMAFRQNSGPARLIVSDPAAILALRPGIRRWPRRQAGWPIVAATCAAVIGLGFALIDQLPNLLAPWVPPAWEAPLGAAIERLLTTQHPRCTGPAGQRALEHLVTRLAESAGIHGRVEVAVLDNPLVNAFTLPGDRVLIMRGLITNVQDGNELAGVMAHELGHVVHRDPTRHLLRQLGIQAVQAALGWNGADTGTLAGTLLGVSYGRAAEAAADEFSVHALRQAGLRADGLEHFFARTEATGADGIGFLSDHPPTSERRRLTEQPPDGDPAFTNAEWLAVRKMCRAS